MHLVMNSGVSVKNIKCASHTESRTKTTGDGRPVERAEVAAVARRRQQCGKGTHRPGHVLGRPF